MGKSNYDNMKNELLAKKIIFDNSERSQAFNEGLDFAVQLIGRYKEGNGFLQDNGEAIDRDELKTLLLKKIDGIKDANVLRQIAMTLVPEDPTAGNLEDDIDAAKRRLVQMGAQAMLDKIKEELDDE